MKTSIAIFVFLLGLGGCYMVTPTQAPGTGDELPAKYAPPAKPMLVLSESWKNAQETEDDAEEVGRAVVSNLKSHKIGPLVDLGQLDQLRESMSSDDFVNITTDALGRRLGAKLVLYVNVIQSELVMDSGQTDVHGEMRVTVKVVDTETGRVVWPANQDGQAIEVTTPRQENESAEAQRKVHQQMIDAMGDAIGNLFHPYRPANEMPADEAAPIQAPG